MNIEVLVHDLHILLHSEEAWIESVKNEVPSYHYNISQMLPLIVTEDVSKEGFILQVKINPHHFYDVNQRQSYARNLLNLIDIHRYDKQIMCSLDEYNNYCISLFVHKNSDVMTLTEYVQLLIEYSKQRSSDMNLEENRGENWIAI